MAASALPIKLPAAEAAGFGLAPIKPEGGTVRSVGNFAKALYPGVRKWWGEEYEKFDPKYTNLFDAVEASDPGDTIMVMSTHTEVVTESVNGG